MIYHFVIYNLLLGVKSVNCELNSKWSMDK